VQPTIGSATAYKTCSATVLAQPQTVALFIPQKISQNNQKISQNKEIQAQGVAQNHILV
jgi:hypothetical protein